MESTIVEAPPTPAVSYRAFWVACARHTVGFLLSLVIGISAYWLFSQNNDFPEQHYHPDEMSKADQIIGGQRNFRHPQLLLELAELRQDWWSIPKRPQEIVIAGRDASAFLAATAVFAATMTGYVAFGFVGLAIAGLTIAICPPLLIHAHYFKEDTALLAGVMLSILGVCLVSKAKQAFPQLLAAAALGIGCGVAISGKYVGAACIAPALLALLIARIPDWYTLPTRIATFAIVAFLTVVMINHRAFLDWTSLQLSPQAIEGIEYEYDHATDTHYGVALRVPNYYALKITALDVMPHLWIFVILGLGWLAYRRQFSCWGIALIAFPITFAIVLSRNVIPMPRYSLPITVSLYLIAALAAAWIVTGLPRKQRWVFPAALAAFIAIILGLQGIRAGDLTRRFNYDSRHEFREWVAKNVPANSRINSDSYTGLMGSGDPVRHPDQPVMRQRVAFNLPVAAFGSVESMARSGVKYVAVSNMNFDRYFEPQVTGSAGNDSVFPQHRQFYVDLFAKGKLLWQSDPQYRTFSYVSMDLRLYDISGLAPASPGLLQSILPARGGGPSTAPAVAR